MPHPPHHGTREPLVLTWDPGEATDVRGDRGLVSSFGRAAKRRLKTETESIVQ